MNAPMGKRVIYFRFAGAHAAKFAASPKLWVMVAYGPTFCMPRKITSNARKLSREPHTFEEALVPICEAVVSVECDKCGFVTDQMSLTALAGGGWDARNIPERLKRDGWRLGPGAETICPECLEQLELP